MRQQGIEADQIIEIPLDDIRYFHLHDPLKCDEYIRGQILDHRPYYLFLDEVQNIENFVALLNGLNRIENLDIYVTGSNSHLLSSQIATEFGGRGQQIHVRPLSYAEFYQAKLAAAAKTSSGVIAVDHNQLWTEYLRYGGIPMIVEQSSDRAKSDLLRDLFSTVYLRDIADRSGLRHELKLQQLTRVLASGIGSLTSVEKLVRSYRSQAGSAGRGADSISANTVNKYFELLADSFLLDKVGRFDIKGRKHIGANAKYFFSDLGLRNACLDFRQIDGEESHLMENVIYNELRQRGYQVTVGVVPASSADYEVDFIAERGDSRVYLQSALTLNTAAKMAQEKRSLQQIRDSFRKILITRDPVKGGVDEDGIEVMSLFKFLLGEPTS